MYKMDNEKVKNWWLKVGLDSLAKQDVTPESLELAVKSLLKSGLVDKNYIISELCKVRENYLTRIEGLIAEKAKYDKDLYIVQECEKLEDELKIEENTIFDYGGI